MWILPKQLITYPYVVGTEELISDLNEQSQACEQSLLVRSKPMRAPIWLRKWKRDSWTQHLSGRILKPSLGQSFVEKWTSCLEVTLVSPSQHQENDLEQKIQDTSGLTLQMELDSCDQTFAFLKTSKDILPLDSEKLLASWKQSVIEQRGEYSAREKLEHRTEENEFLSWPTPTASDITGPNPTQLINGSFKSKHSLNPNSPWYGARLKDAVMSYSTPTARMWKDTGTMPAEFRRNTPSLAIQVGGKLNADWVEWLMGIPTGWTDCDCAATALSQQLPH